MIVAAGADSGLFLTLDNGQHWQTITLDGRSMYRARTARFAHIDPATTIVFIGSQGNGVWRVALSR